MTQLNLAPLRWVSCAAETPVLIRVSLLKPLLLPELRPIADWMLAQGNSFMIGRRDARQTLMIPQQFLTIVNIIELSIAQLMGNVADPGEIALVWATRGAGSESATWSVISQPASTVWINIWSRLAIKFNYQRLRLAHAHITVIDSLEL